MGKSVTPKYRFEIQEANDPRTHVQSWNGRALSDRLVEYIRCFEKSTTKGGVNDHLGPRLVLTAKIIDQKTNKVIVTYIK